MCPEPLCADPYLTSILTLVPKSTSPDTAPKSKSPVASPKLSPTPDPQQAKATRAKELRRVFEAFDLDGGGDVGADEMMALGQARRKLGQKSGEWTEEQNKQMLRNMGADSEGNVNASKFVTYFNEKLPTDPTEFAECIAQFVSCAKTVNEKKRASRKQESPATRNTEPKCDAVPIRNQTSPVCDLRQLLRRRSLTSLL